MLFAAKLALAVALPAVTSTDTALPSVDALTDMALLPAAGGASENPLNV